MIGHSQGEIAAACVAGALSLEDAARVVALRSQAIAEALAGQGGMVSVALAVDDAASRALPDGVSRRRRQRPAHRRRLRRRRGARRAAGRSCTPRASGPGGSRSTTPRTRPHVELLEERLLADLAADRPRAGTIPFYSTVDGGLIDTAELDADYWYRNLREPVRFAPTVGGCSTDGASLFVEASPHPVLTGAVHDTLDAGAAAAIGTLRRDDGGPRALRRRAGQGPRRTAPPSTGPRCSPARGASRCPPTPSSASATG